MRGQAGPFGRAEAPENGGGNVGLAQPPAGKIGSFEGILEPFETVLYLFFAGLDPGPVPELPGPEMAFVEGRNELFIGPECDRDEALHPAPGGAVGRGQDKFRGGDAVEMVENNGTVDQHVAVRQFQDRHSGDRI